MKKKLVLLLVLVLAVSSAFVLSACTSDANLLKTGENNSFTYDNLTALQKDWTLSTADSRSVSEVFTVSDGAISINTSGAGWGKATQKVNLKSNSYYMIEYNYTANVFSSFGDKGYDGFYISIEEDDDFNRGTNCVEHRAQTTSRQVGRLYFKTNSAKNTTISINVGNEEYPVTVNSVTIYDIKLVKVSRSDIVSEGAAYQTFKSDYYGDASGKNVVWVILGGIAALLIGYCGYVLYQRNMALETGYKNKFLCKIRDSKWLGVILVGALTLFIRLLIDILTTAIAGTKLYSTLGYNAEGYAAQALFIGRYGTGYLGESLSRFCSDNGYTYMAVGSNPILLYFLGLFGAISRIFVGHEYLAAIFFVRFFATLLDVATVVLLYIMLRDKTGNVGATIMASVYSIMPVVFCMSSMWGIVESGTVFLILLTTYFILKNNFYGASATYLVAFLYSINALIFAPIVIFYAIQQAINNKNLWISISVGFVVGFMVFYLLNLPFDINQVKAGTAFACVVKYWNLAAKNLLYTLNAFNFQAILGNNFSTVTTESLIVSIIFVVFMLALVAFGYFKNKNRMDLILLATAFINMVFMFSNNMTPWVLAMNLALMLAYAIINKEKRIYFSFVIFAALAFVNVSIGELLYPYSSTAIYNISNASAAVYVFSAFYLAMTLYYIYVAYDIIVSKKVRKIQPMTLTYLDWWKNLFRRIQKAYYKMRIKTQKQ